MSLCNLLRRSPLFHRLCSATNTTTSRSTVRISHIQQRFYNIQQRFYNAPRLASSLVGQRLNLHDRVQSLIRASDLDAASRLARQSVCSDTRPTVSTCNAIIAGMYRAKRYSESISLFQYFFKQSNIVPNLVSYNLLINAHCDEGQVEEALEVYRHILANAPFAPSSVTYRHLTKGLVQAGRIGDAASLLREMLSKGQAADSMVYNNLIRGYLDLGDLDKANEFFDELKSECKVSDGIVNATWMEYWFKQGNDEEAMKSYRSLMDKKFRAHPPTGNLLLEVFLKYGKKTEAWALFNEMLDNHTLNSETVNKMVNECFKMGQFTEAIDTFKKVGTKLDYVCYSNIVTRFCEQGMIPEAERFFAEGLTKGLHVNAPSHRAMIDAYLKAERIDDALKMLIRMVDVNLRVVADFGTRVFGVLIKNGKLTESAEVLTKMGEREPKPDPPIYDVVVRGLCNGGALDQAKDIIGQMVGHGVEVAPVLREFIMETFQKGGRCEEIEKTLNSDQTTESASPPFGSRKVLPRIIPKASPSRSRITLKKNSLAKAAAVIAPSVVHIFRPEGPFGKRSTGTGIIVNNGGTIITCAHVVVDKFRLRNRKSEKKGVVSVSLSDGSVYSGVVFDYRLDDDIALVRIKPAVSLSGAKFSREACMGVGDLVLTAGSTLGWPNSFTHGVISCTSRAHKELLDLAKNTGNVYLQLDCGASAGNSGGPIVNLDGVVIGVVVCGVDGGLEFALRCDTVFKILKRMGYESLLETDH